MLRFVVSIGVMIVMAFSILYINLVPIQTSTGEAAYTPGLGIIDWSLLALAGGLAVISLWGIAGVALSKLKSIAAESSMNEVKISTKSWHYRLSIWLNNGKQPSAVRSECEYWATLAHGLTHFTPLIAIGWVITLFALTIYWLFGARANFSFLDIRSDAHKDFTNHGHQWLGPAVLAAILISGMVLGLTLGGWGGDIFSFSHWRLIGWSLLGLGLVAPTSIVITKIAKIAGKIPWHVLCFPARAVKAPFSFLLVRFVARACRPVKFT